MKRGPHWWRGQPDIYECPHCGCPIQRTRHGRLVDGIREHNERIHPEQRNYA